MNKMCIYTHTHIHIYAMENCTVMKMRKRAMCISMDKFYNVGSRLAVIEEYNWIVYLYNFYLKYKTLYYLWIFTYGESKDEYGTDNTKFRSSVCEWGRKGNVIGRDTWGLHFFI